MRQQPFLSRWLGNVFEPYRSDSEAVGLEGGPLWTYRHESVRAQAAMVAHVENLLRLYGGGIRRTPDGRAVMQTMFEPLPRPNDARALAPDRSAAVRGADAALVGVPVQPTGSRGLADRSTRARPVRSG